MPNLTLKDNDQNWVLALASELYEANGEDALFKLAELLLSTKIERSKPPQLSVEDLPDLVAEELYELVADSRSDTDIQNLFNQIRAHDSDFDFWVFGSGEEFPRSILVPDRRLRSVAEHAYEGCMEYLSIYPQRCPTSFSTDSVRLPSRDSSAEEEELVVKAIEEMIRERRAWVFSRLISSQIPLQMDDPITWTA